MAENRPDIRAVPAGYDSNVRRRAHSLAGKHPSKLGFAARITAGAGLVIGGVEAGVLPDEPVQAVVRTVEDVVGQGKELVDRDLTDEQKKADALLVEARKQGKGGALVTNLIVVSKESVPLYNNYNFRKKVPDIGWVSRQPIGEISGDELIQVIPSGIVVWGKNSENPKDLKSETRVLAFQRNGELVFADAGNFVTSGDPDGIYSAKPISLE